MKIVLLVSIAACAVVYAQADNDATSLAFDTHVLLADADSSADKVITSMDNVAQAIAAADDKLQQIIAKAKAGVKKQQAGDNTVKADFVTLSHKAAKAMSAPGGFDWQQFVPNKKPAGTMKVVNMADSTQSASGSSSTKSTGGYDWSKWAPKDTSGGAFNKAPSGVLIASKLEMTPEAVATQATAMCDEASSAADTLAETLNQAAKKLKEASEKLKAKVAEAKAAVGSTDDDTTVDADVPTSTSLRSPVAHESSSIVPTVLGLVAVGGLVAGVVYHKRNRDSYERL